jgi:hypothetical protein
MPQRLLGGKIIEIDPWFAIILESAQVGRRDLNEKRLSKRRGVF